MRRAASLTLAALCLAVAGSAIALGQSARVELGGKFFIDSGCYGCHMVGRLGTSIGPDLTRVGAKYPREYLERWLRDPLLQRPTAHMPKLELTEDQVRALAAYLSSLQ